MAINSIEDIDKKELIKKIVHQFSTVSAIYIFGSFATGEIWPTSDLDLAILPHPTSQEPISEIELIKLAVTLGGNYKRKVDLVNLKNISTVFQKEIIYKGSRIYCSDEFFVENFEVLVLSYYQRLNYERREILESFQKNRRAYNI